VPCDASPTGAQDGST
jgi:hypothetical protein